MSTTTEDQPKTKPKTTGMRAPLIGKKRMTAPPMDAKTEKQGRILLKNFETTPQGFADRLVHLYGHLFFRKTENKWEFFIWKKTHWELDVHNNGMTKLVQAMLGKMKLANHHLTVDPTQRKSLHKLINGKYSSSGYDRTTELAGRVHNKPAHKLDANPMLFNCTNGTLDLSDGELYEHDSDDFITRIADVDYDADATHPTWTRFIKATFPNKQTRDFVQMALGTCLTGDYSDEAFYILQGVSGTGKSTLVDAIAGVLGNSYATSAPDVQTLAPSTSPGKPRPDLVRMMGMRFVTIPETDKHQTLPVSMLKRMTGGDSNQVRQVFKGDYQDLRPSYKLWICTNYPIQFPDSLDDAIWRRLIVIPMNHKPSAPDPTVKETLRDDSDCRAAILAWLVQGCRKWLAQGRQITQHRPSEVLEAIAAYQTSINPLAPFFEERLRFDPDEWLASSALHDAFNAYCKERNLKPVSQHDLGRRLRSHECSDGTRRIGRRTERGWKGVQLQ